MIFFRLAIVSGTIRSYCEKKNDPTLAGQVLTRALVPVAFPRPKKETADPTLALRNYWAFISCRLPIGVEGVKDRLAACHRSMEHIKGSLAGPIQMWLQTNLLPLLPKSLQRKTGHDVFSRHTLVFSNVPGPPVPITFCKEKVLGNLLI